jgi:hypothetical protein
MVRVVEAHHLRDYVIWVAFDDGLEGEVDLSDELHGPVFEPLRDKDVFASLRVDPSVQTVVWPNGADLAPEFLHSRVRVPA